MKQLTKLAYDVNMASACIITCKYSKKLKLIKSSPYLWKLTEGEQSRVEYRGPKAQTVMIMIMKTEQHHCYTMNILTYCVYRLISPLPRYLVMYIRSLASDSFQYSFISLLHFFLCYKW
jgi:hypothetical protein